MVIRSKHFHIWTFDIPPELRLRDGEPPDSLPQTKCFSKEPSEFHPGPSKGWTLRWTSIAKATQWFSDLSGGSNRRSQEPASLARQVKAAKNWFWTELCWIFTASQNTAVTLKGGVHILLSFLQISIFQCDRIFVTEEQHCAALSRVNYHRTTGADTQANVWDVRFTNPSHICSFCSHGHGNDLTERATLHLMQILGRAPDLL